MRKFVLKVALITVVCLFFVFSATVLSVSFFSPQSISKVCYDVGFENTALYYAKKAYLKDSSLEKCDYMLKIAIKCNDRAVIEQYSEDFLNNENLWEYFEENKINKDYYDFIASHYVMLSFVEGEPQSSEFIYKAMAYSRDYRKGCAINAVISKCFENGDKETLEQIKSTLIVFFQTNCPQDRKSDCKKTIDTIQLYIDK